MYQPLVHDDKFENTAEFAEIIFWKTRNKISRIF